jgi:hypothetical protein
VKVKFKSGLMVQTNGAFAKIVRNSRPIPGVLLRPMTHPAGSWAVRLDGFDKPHHVHEKMMEPYTMELETTAEAWEALPKSKRVALVWIDAGKSASWPEWHAVIDGESLPARIRELDKKTYSVYRNGKYLGSEPSLDSAKQRAVINQQSQKNRVMRIWEREHPNELPPVIQLTDAEREEYWRVHAASKPKTGRTTSAAPAQAVRPKPGVREVDGVEAEPRERKPRTTVPGGNAAKIAELLKRKDGCTREEVLEATGWTAVSIQQQAKSAGLTLRVDKSRKPFRYFAE